MSEYHTRCNPSFQRWLRLYDMSRKGQSVLYSVSRFVGERYDWNTGTMLEPAEFRRLEPIAPNESFIVRRISPAGRSWDQRSELGRPALIVKSRWQEISDHRIPTAPFVECLSNLAVLAVPILGLPTEYRRDEIESYSLELLDEVGESFHVVFCPTEIEEFRELAERIERLAAFLASCCMVSFDEGSVSLEG